VPTDLVIISFADRIMVTLSQSGKFGTLVRAGWIEGRAKCARVCAWWESKRGQVH
jgi:hypothetical protein